MFRVFGNASIQNLRGAKRLMSRTRERCVKISLSRNRDCENPGLAAIEVS